MSLQHHTLSTFLSHHSQTTIPISPPLLNPTKLNLKPSITQRSSPIMQKKQKMPQENRRPIHRTSKIDHEELQFLKIMKEVSSLGDKNQARALLGISMKLGFLLNPEIADKITASLAIGHDLRYAQQVFDEMPDKRILAYASLINAYCRKKEWCDVLRVFSSMVADGLNADKFLLPSLLKACSGVGSPLFGRQIHGYIVRRGIQIDVFVGNSLIDMYAKCGEIDTAGKVFKKMPERDVVSWTSMLSAYLEIGLLDEAIDCFESMVSSGVRPDVIAWNALISGFSQQGDVDRAVELFEEMRVKGPSPGVNSWNGVISGCMQNSYFDDALMFFREMQFYMRPNAITIASILPACSHFECLLLGREIHAYTIKHGIQSNMFVHPTMIDMYMKCGQEGYAVRLFDSLDEKNCAVWNVMIAGYASIGNVDAALDFLVRMKASCVKPDTITYNTLLAYYGREGKRSEVLTLLSEMISMGLIPNTISMNVVISGFQQAGHSAEALEFFRAMQLQLGSERLRVSDDAEDTYTLNVRIMPNEVTLTSVLSACSDSKSKLQGKAIQAYVIRHEHGKNVYVSSTLVDMYAKCNDMNSAEKAFHCITNKNTVSWNSLMAGYNYNSRPESALKLLSSMIEDGVSPSSVTGTILLTACSDLVLLRLGHELHGYAIKSDLSCDASGSFPKALIDMYIKCGSIEEAKKVFDATSRRDVSLWNIMMSGYAVNKMAVEVIDLFEELKLSGLKPDHYTLLAVLNACSHEGMMEEGMSYFSNMEKDYGVKPSIEHYTCIVRMMGNMGLLDEALDFIKMMPFEPDACTWSTLLRACRAHSNVSVGETAAKALFHLEPENPANYIAIANIYATAGMWDLNRKTKDMMEEHGVEVIRECSRIEMDRKIYRFESGRTSYPHLDEILDVWDDLAGQMVEKGYDPCDVYVGKRSSMSSCDDPFCCFHTEKLAICLGILGTTRRQSAIRVVKNLRMCIDCHTSAKLITEIVGREIIVRDACFYHHFKDGACSCKDKW